ncbi:MAG: hypothetical protein COV29_03110 [Candidatus Yanofskybacteria bacterium CG10_big_fil_rev_8_21_14_0_10_36_16]|uniref:Uncharacterized protein n=1 Tax=Candidatus Yanofskybacteria bacterium CG10_big_fil_rev_8_21_14_0_10_36_16 TaxID=1975096 RepID=A0A2J0Q6X4_9BACT|nr:MAG: hypothetical protein COV29_03110 [Candidatus Yanofskybacteria bacterium CG10_big_fil_rev_8_21_14_0_10_36_16]
MSCWKESPIKHWYETEQGEKLARLLFQDAGLPEVPKVAKVELEQATYTNQQILEMTGSLTTLMRLLRMLPQGGSVEIRRMALSTLVNEEQKERSRTETTSRRMYFGS